MDLNLAGKVVLVTGSTTGIGEGIARVFAKEGATVIIHGRDRDRANRIAAELSALGNPAFAVVGAVHTKDGAQSIRDQVFEQESRVDILVNNVGTYRALAWMETQPEQWLETYSSNVVSAVRMTHHFVPGMIERGFGRIVQIASNAAHIAFPHLADYAASKAAMVSMSVSLAQSLAGTGVTANTVSPGPVSTPAWDRWALEEGSRRGWSNDIDDVKRLLLEDFFKNPSNRFGDAEEIGAMVALIASPRMGYVNGANLRVDGGRVPTVN